MRRKKKCSCLGRETSDDFEKQTELFKFDPVGDREPLKVTQQLSKCSKVI